MRRIALPLVVFAAGCFAGSASFAATGWHVFASGAAKGQDGAYATASADAPRSSAFAIRVASSPAGPVSLWFNLACTGKRQVASGSVTLVTVAAASGCSLHAMANTTRTGSVRLELLRR